LARTSREAAGRCCLSVGTELLGTAFRFDIRHTFTCAICRRSRLLSRGPSSRSCPPRPSHLHSPRQDGSTAVSVRRLAGDMLKRPTHFGVSRTYSGRTFRRCGLSGCTHRTKPNASSLASLLGRRVPQPIPRALRTVKADSRGLHRTYRSYRS
jgi:hypothetical protein